MRGLETAENILDEGSVLVVDSDGPLFQALTGGPSDSLVWPCSTCMTASSAVLVDSGDVAVVYRFGAIDRP